MTIKTAQSTVEDKVANLYNALSKGKTFYYADLTFSVSDQSTEISKTWVASVVRSFVDSENRNNRAYMSKDRAIKSLCDTFRSYLSINWPFTFTDSYYDPNCRLIVQQGCTYRLWVGQADRPIFQIKRRKDGETQTLPGIAFSITPDAIEYLKSTAMLDRFEQMTDEQKIVDEPIKAQPVPESYMPSGFDIEFTDESEMFTF